MNYSKHQPTNQVVAVKMMNMDQMDQEYQVGDPTDAIKDLSAEITALKELRESGAKNVNIMLDAFVLDNEMWIVAEFCTGGSVHALVSESALVESKRTRVSTRRQAVSSRRFTSALE